MHLYVNAGPLPRCAGIVNFMRDEFCRCVDSKEPCRIHAMTWCKKKNTVLYKARHLPLPYFSRFSVVLRAFYNCSFLNKPVVVTKKFGLFGRRTTILIVHVLKHALTRIANFKNGCTSNSEVLFSSNMLKVQCVSLRN